MIINTDFNPNILVSINVLVFNHEKYLQECINSILSQHTNFYFEIILSDDCSTDSSREICKQYQSAFPSLFKLNFQKHNKGLIDNYKESLSLCSGQYIAILSGDDYWCDNNKLQKQVDFLQVNKEFSMCFTNALLYEDWSKESYVWPYTTIIEGEYLGENIIRKWTVPASSVMFRNHLIDFSFLDKNRFFAEDLITYLKLNEVGKLYALADITTVYRLHKGQITENTNSEHNRNFVKTLVNIDSELNYKYHKIIYTDIASYYIQRTTKDMHTLTKDFKRIFKFIFLKYFKN